MAAHLFPIVAAVLTWGATWAFLRVMQAHHRQQPPSARGMHNAPVVTGAGAVIVAVICALTAGMSGNEPLAAAGTLIVLAALLAALSWIDDQHGGLSPLVRLAAHAAAVTVMLFQLDGAQRAFPVLPLAAERVLLAVAWVWFINLFNFMDGIDGLAGSETIAISIGYSLVMIAISGVGLASPVALTLAGAAAGYLVWNWPPAKVMMGDTGSIPLGFLLGWLMLDLALRGYPVAAFILPLYFVTDATLTLGRRVLGGELPWTPHRDHTYQRAALAAGSHAAVVLRVAAVNAVLVALAALSVHYTILALLGAIGTVTALTFHLERMARSTNTQAL